MNNDDNIQSRLIEAIDNLDKTVNNLAKTTDRMVSFCSLMLLVLFATIVLAIVF